MDMASSWVSKTLGVSDERLLTMFDPPLTAVATR
jgi:hypothetical protein